MQRFIIKNWFRISIEQINKIIYEVCHFRFTKDLQSNCVIDVRDQFLPTPMSPEDYDCGQG